MIKKTLFLILVISLSGCAALRPYDFVYVDDPEMQVGDSYPKNFENYFESIREGATPSSGSKTSGGCGCN